MKKSNADGYRIVSSIHNTYTRDSNKNYFSEWLSAVSTYTIKRKQSLIDIAVDAANLGVNISRSGQGFNDSLAKQAIIDTNPRFDFVSPPSGDELMGALNSAKGKYFEYLVVDKLNSGERVGDIVLPWGFSACLAENFSQPGWDIQILDSSGYVSDYLQLKATDSLAYIKEAFDRYPSIQILATDEIAETINGSMQVLDSDVSNEWLQEKLLDAIDTSDTSSFGESFIDAFNPLLSLGIIAATEGYTVCFNDKDINTALSSSCYRASKSIASQSVGAFVYAIGGGILAVPTSVMTGLVIQHMKELYDANQVIHQSHIQLVQLRIAQQEARLLGGSY